MKRNYRTLFGFCPMDSTSLKSILSSKYASFGKSFIVSYKVLAFYKNNNCQTQTNPLMHFILQLLISKLSLALSGLGFIS